MSKFFKPSEFACKCHYPDCDAPAMEADFLKKADAMRQLWGKPLMVNSGVRCRRHNADVGGEKNSQHMKGKAADFRTANRDESLELAKCAEAVGFGGIGVYGTWIHCDTGPSRRWTK